MATHTTYRPDIDGLRAIAVLSVVIFHAFPRYFAGGYIGVDIFFVISGYLISSIIIKDLRRNTFSIFDFYGRRIRRIFPALLLVLITCYALGWFLLFEDEYSALGKNIAGGTGFISNFILWNDSGYFDQSSELKPLLHLWSLAIEEQFYLVWPLLLWFAHKRQFSLLLLTSAVGAVSFIYNAYIVNVDRVAAFYSPISRFWELLFGAGLAYFTLKPAQPGNLPIKEAGEAGRDPDRTAHSLNNKKSTSGFLLLACGLLLLNGSSPFPGWLALLPVVGATLIISAGPDAWLNKHILSSKLFVSIGLISYPLYLWHWPLLSLLHIIEGGEATSGNRLIMVGISVGLAWLTFTLVEKPVRIFTFAYHTPLTYGLFSGMLAIGLAGLVTFSNDGFKFRDIAVVASEIAIARQDHHENDAFFVDGRIDETGHRFEGKNTDAVLFIGDSLMNHYLPRLEELYKNTNDLPFYSSVFLPRNGCRPVPSGQKINTAGKNCDEYYAAILKLAQSTNIKKLVLAANWELVFSDESLAENNARLLADLGLLKSMGKSIHVIAMAPHSRLLNPLVLAKPLRLGAFGGGVSLQNQGLKRGDLEAMNTQFARLTEFTATVGGSLVNPLDYFCTDDHCPTVEDGKPLFSDTFHITSLAVKQYATFIDPIVKD